MRWRIVGYIVLGVVQAVLTLIILLSILSWSNLSAVTIDNIPFIYSGMGIANRATANTDTQLKIEELEIPIISEHSDPQILPIPLFDSTEIKQQLLNAIDSNNHDNIGFYFKDVKRNYVVEYNSTKYFSPGSITKLPYGILIMKRVQAGELSLNTVIPLQNNLKRYDHDYLYSFPQGAQLTVNDYLKALFSYSDSTAMLHFESYFGGFDTVQQAIKTELGIETFSRNPNLGTPYDTYKLMSYIYSPDSFLNSDSQKLIQKYLYENYYVFQWRIRGRLPKDLFIPNKIGNLSSPNGVAVSDTAIIYGKNSEYIFTVLTTDFPNTGRAEVTTQEISRIMYDHFESLP